MKPTTSSKTGLFTIILFAAATAFAMGSMTGCAAPTAADEESATASSDRLDGEKPTQEKIEYDPELAENANLHRTTTDNGGGGVDVGDGVTTRKKQNVQ
jgi:hypothetical protein